ncbi:hypothetical protein OH76DRAFT_846061 [Lentinus brumalis]|uniref:Secreted protein n=1 Tax=Lentinus brumalis TaxID=2498619 RepID=A0A371DQT0_9APHY|nr:hypothetical protein OH76DRAFT_846061 [Polyporus brumalis]
MSVRTSTASFCRDRPGSSRVWRSWSTLLLLHILVHSAPSKPRGEVKLGFDGSASLAIQLRRYRAPKPPLVFGPSCHAPVQWHAAGRR